MKKWICAFLCAALLACNLTVVAETDYDALIAAIDASAGLQEAVDLASEAGTLDGQLALLNELADVYANQLETGGWDVSMTFEAGDGAESLIPDTENAVKPEDPIAVFQGHKIIALYDSKNMPLRLLGDFYARLPAEMRASSVAEVDAVLYLKTYAVARTDYIGSAYNQVFEIYLKDLKDGTVYLVYETYTTPPLSGRGVLSGEMLSMKSLWYPVYTKVYGTISVEYPEGMASFRVTGKTCSICALEGDFVYYEVPAEVEGYPVKVIESIKSETLESLVLPEGIETIRSIKCPNLLNVNFPTTLKRITGAAFSNDGGKASKITEWHLNDGLEEIGDNAIALCSGYVTLPSTLKSVGRSFFKYGVENSYLVFPDGVTAVPDFCLYNTRRLICVYLRESITYIGSDALGYGKNVIIYTPEGSYAARWAANKGAYWVACDDPDDMPHPEYRLQGDYEYAVVGDEAFIYKYTGSEACVIVPDSFDGVPVTTVMEEAFYENDTLRVIVLPDSTRRLNNAFANSCENLEAVFIPKEAKTSSLLNHANYITSGCGGVTIYTPADAVCREHAEHAFGVTWAEWLPGLEAQVIAQFKD